MLAGKILVVSVGNDVDIVDTVPEPGAKAVARRIKNADFIVSIERKPV